MLVSMPQVCGETRIVVRWIDSRRLCSKELSSVRALIQWRLRNLDLAICEIRYWSYEDSKFNEIVWYVDGTVAGFDDGKRVNLIIDQGDSHVLQLLQARIERRRLLATRPRPEPRPQRSRREHGRFGLVA